MHARPMVLDNDDLRVDDPGQHQGDEQRDQIEGREQPRFLLLIRTFKSSTSARTD